MLVLPNAISAKLLTASLLLLDSSTLDFDDDDDVDRNLMSDIVGAALEDFSKVTGNHEEHTLLLREAFLSKLNVVVCSTSAGLARKSPELDKKFGFRVRTLQRYLTRFEPAMHGAIIKYFMQMGAKDVLFGAKVSGKQAGTVAEVVCEDRRVKYFIKCSRAFYENGKSPDHALKDKLELVDYKELFVYRVLEKLGLGPKVEFILAPEVVGPTATDKTAVLIATEDLTTTTPFADSRNTSGDSSHFLSHALDVQMHKFSTCAEIIAAEREKLSAAGITDPEVMEERLNHAMEDIFSTPTAQRDLKTIDLLCRAMHLGDVLINRGNFGRVINATTGEEIGWRVVDFVMERCQELHQKPASYDSPRIAAEFRTVSGRLYYGGFYALRKVLLESASLGDETKRLLLQQLGLEAALTAALEEIAIFLTENKDGLCIDAGLHERKMVDLSAYARAAWHNVVNA